MASLILPQPPVQSSMDTEGWQQVLKNTKKSLERHCWIDQYVLLMDISTGANKTINKHNIGLGNCPKIGFRAALAALDIARFIHFHYLMGHIMV